MLLAAVEELVWVGGESARWATRQISRQLHLARQTVRKALASVEIPRYHLTKPRPCPAMDTFADIIHTWLDQDKVAPPKQRHTARRIYDFSVGTSPKVVNY